MHHPLHFQWNSDRLFGVVGERIMRLSEFIKAERLRMGLNQTQFGRRARVSHTYIRKLEGGHSRRPEAPKLGQLASFLGVSLEVLLAMANEENLAREGAKQKEGGDVNASPTPTDRPLSPSADPAAGLPLDEGKKMLMAESLHTVAELEGIIPNTPALLKMLAELPSNEIVIIAELIVTLHSRMVFAQAGQNRRLAVPSPQYRLTQEDVRTAVRLLNNGAMPQLPEPREKN